jgi:hypothetical protein
VLAISFTSQKKKAVHLSHLLNNNYGQSKTPGLIFENRCSALLINFSIFSHVNLRVFDLCTWHVRPCGSTNPHGRK